jgi:uncharacterized protein DUF6812
VDEAPRPLRVPTERIEALIRTSDQQLILGKVHSQPGKRLKDELNSDSARFIAVTDARVYDASGGQLLYEAAFLLLANDHIVTVTPRSSLTGSPLPWLQTPSE